MTASTANLWAVAGLVYMLAGAALLALSVYSAPHPAAGPVERDLQTSVAQWLDGRIGAALIVAGLFFQTTGAVGTPTLNTPAIFLLLGLALAAGYYALSKDLLVEKLAAAGDLGRARVEPPLTTQPAIAPPAPAPLVVVPAAEVAVQASETETVIVDLRPRESTG